MNIRQKTPFLFEGSLEWSPAWPEKQEAQALGLRREVSDRVPLLLPIYKAHTAALGWSWMAADGNRDLGHGYEPTARQAATKAEAVYFR